MDARIAIKPDFEIKPEEILQMATRLHQSALALGIASAMALSSQGYRGGHSGSFRGTRGRGGFRGSRGMPRHSGQGSQSTSTSSVPPPDEWAKQHLTADFPCNVCWEWGHWAPDCPRVKSNLPPLEDPRRKNPSWRPKKSNVISGRLITQSGELASISAPPENPEDPLCDTGATHHNAFP